MQTELQKIVNTWKIKIGAEYRIYRTHKQKVYNMKIKNGILK